MKAERSFRVALYMMLLFAFGHMMGFAQAAYVARHDPAFASLTAAMRAQQTEVMGFRASILDFREYFSVNFSILLVTASIAGFVALRHAVDRTAAERALARVYGAGMLALLATSFVFSVAQGIVTCGTIVALCAWSATRSE